MRLLYAGFVLAIVALLCTAPVTGQQSRERLIVYGDVVYFMGQGKPRNCTATSQVRRGEPVGFRMTAINPATGARDRATKLVLHLTYGGRTIDLPMQDHETERRPEANFWIAKWIVPDDAPTGSVSYTVTAQDPQGRTGEFKPFAIEASQLAVIP
jgi:hypothetical protein